LEQVFKKTGSWVDFQIKETPGSEKGNERIEHTNALKGKKNEQ